MSDLVRRVEAANADFLSGRISWPEYLALTRQLQAEGEQISAEIAKTLQALMQPNE